MVTASEALTATWRPSPAGFRRTKPSSPVSSRTDPSTESRVVTPPSWASTLRGVRAPTSVRAVGGAPAAVGGSAACGERERARAEEGDRTPLRDNGSHQLHGGSLSADENASQLGGDGPGAGAARPDLAGCGAWAGAARPGPAGRGQAGAVGDGLMAATAGDNATARR